MANVHRFTAKVIQKVLAAPSGIDPNRAGDLMSLLAKEVAPLVVPAPDGSLQHRPELRRLIMKDLGRGGPANTVREIQDRAVSYYSAEPARPSTRAEEIYHLLMRLFTLTFVTI